MTTSTLGWPYVPKMVQIGPVGSAGQRGERECSTVSFLFLFVTFLAKLWRTHFWEYRHILCTGWRVSVQIDFLGGSQHSSFIFSPLNPPKPQILGPFSDLNYTWKCLTMEILIYKLPLIVIVAPQSGIVNRQCGLGNSKYVVILDPCLQVTWYRACAVNFWPLTIANANLRLYISVTVQDRHMVPMDHQ